MSRQMGAPHGVQELDATVVDALGQRRRDQEYQRLRAQLPILEISQALMADGDVESMAGPLLETVAQQVGVERAILLLLDEGAGVLRVVGAIGLPTERVEEWRIPLDRHFIQQVLSAEEPYVVDASSQESLESPCHLLLPDSGTAAVCIPLRARKRTVGLLTLTRPERPGGPSFTTTDLSLLSIMGRQIATTLDNVRLYEEVKAARDYAQTVVDSLHDQVFVLTKDLVIADVNDAFVHCMGYTRQEVLGHHCYQISHQRDRPCAGPDHPCPAAEVWATGRLTRRVHIHFEKSGERRYVEVMASPLYDNQGRIVQVVAAYRDLTAEWRLESSLSTIRALGQRLVLSRDEVEIGQMVVDTAEQVLDYSVCDLWLVDTEQGVLVRHASTVAANAATPSPISLNSERGIIAAAARSGEAIYVPDTSQNPRLFDAGLGNCSELTIPLKIGERVLGVLDAESSKVDAFDEGSRQLFCTLADQAALALENARLFGEINHQEFNEKLVLNMDEGIVVEDTAGHFVFINPAGAAMLGYEPQELIGCHWQEIVPVDQRPVVEAANERRRVGESDRYELSLRHRDGTRLPVWVAGRPLLQGEHYGGSLAVFSNLTEVKQLQKQLIQSEKLAALGRMAASLAHEINNPLQALRSGLGLLVGRSVEAEKQQRYLQVASREVERLISITERMLSFYRPSTELRELTDVNEVVDETLALTGKKLQHSRVSVRRDLAPRPLLVKAVADQLKQVFLNIILNALDAMPQGGSLEIKTGGDDAQREVWISFADTGEGIPAESIPRVFEPFYTTKPKGTGLGLSVSYGIVERHGGRIEVQSQVGEGCVFAVFLPSVGATHWIEPEGQP